MTVFIILLVLIALVLAIAYICYRIAFLAPTRVAGKDVQIHLPDGEPYIKVRKNIEKCVNDMLARPFEPITITTYDGKKLYARYYHVADGAPVQIQFHGYKSSAILDFCGGSLYAGKIGHNAIVVDQRSHGRSEGNAITFGVLERKDVLSWIEYARSRFGKDVKIILAGLSMGAATVLMATDLELPDNVVGVIADCPYSAPSDIIKLVGKRDMHLPAGIMYPFLKLAARLFAGFDLEESSAVAAVKNTKLPILLIHGEADAFVPCDMSREIYAANPDMITLVTIPEAGHGLCYMTDPKCYENAMIEFIEKVLV
ncbi:MAG: alpha/beta hydrolase [Roseburia sp.]|nr:alpha/beta hydrolase [Roseburia sp.]